MSPALTRTSKNEEERSHDIFGEQSVILVAVTCDERRDPAMERMEAVEGKRMKDQRRGGKKERL
jgi:hypothetical protein